MVVELIKYVILQLAALITIYQLVQDVLLLVVLKPLVLATDHVAHMVKEVASVQMVLTTVLIASLHKVVQILHFKPTIKRRQDQPINSNPISSIGCKWSQ